MSTLIYLAIPMFLLTLVLEALWMRRARARGLDVVGYERRDTIASLAMGIGDLGVSAIVKLAAVPTLFWMYDHRVCNAPSGALGFALLFFGEDFCYYWFHRTSHESRLFWAAHVNHHSSQHYNLSTALRQSWTQPLMGVPFWWPLALIGFKPELIVMQQAVSLLYQYWIHTESIRTLGPIEWIFNTPSHHRVHHGMNPEYIDRNHAGILIIWDRMFGTFEPERARPKYGLTKNIETFNPLRIAFHEWGAIFGDVRRATSWKDALGYAFAPPGWRPKDAIEPAKQAEFEAARSG
jgi:sterol desaturase/sphingolipid hydroxylase (fatty acid hydroxylase superfamily)